MLKPYHSRVTSPGNVSCLKCQENLGILASLGKKELFCEPGKESSKTVCLSMLSSGALFILAQRHTVTWWGFFFFSFQDPNIMPL